MFRRAALRLEGVADFVDTAYLRNQRPKVPGGAWSFEFLQGKSIADLQLIWFTLIRERNMLYSMKDHYMRHNEELGAMPAPSRIRLVEDSIAALRKVMMARDGKAADEAEAMFRERVARGIYNPNAGPQPPPDYRLRERVSHATVRLSKFVDEDRLRELFGRFDVFDNNRGIAELTVELSPETAARKERAEAEFADWYWRTNDKREYDACTETPSFFDECVGVELAPGVFLSEDAAVAAGSLPVPLTATDAAPGQTALERIRHADRTYTERQVIQLGYYPNLTSEAPAAPGPRPTHPDELEGEYVCRVLYSVPGAKTYLDSLALTRIDGAVVLGVEDTTDAWIDANPLAATSPEYAESVGQENASTTHFHEWPFVPKWKDEYRKLAMADPADIVVYNFNNVSEYVEREALLTNANVYECPTAIDPSCGNADRIPPHAEPPVETIPDRPYAREQY